MPARVSGANDHAIPQLQEVLKVEGHLWAQAHRRWSPIDLHVQFVDILSDGLIQYLSSWQEMDWHIKGEFECGKGLWGDGDRLEKLRHLWEPTSCMACGVIQNVYLSVPVVNMYLSLPVVVSLKDLTVWREETKQKMTSMWNGWTSNSAWIMCCGIVHLHLTMRLRSRVWTLSV